MKEIEYAINLRKQGKLIESNKALLSILEMNKLDAYINYQVAWSFDVLGMESEAISYYLKSIEIGLEDKDLVEAYIGLGSSYRLIGEYEDSKNTLLKALELFNIKTIKIFLAMTYQIMGDETKAKVMIDEVRLDKTYDPLMDSYEKTILEFIKNFK